MTSTARRTALARLVASPATALASPAPAQGAFAAAIRKPPMAAQDFAGRPQ